MKKNNLFLMLCICALAFFNANEVLAKGEPTFYAKLKTQVGNGCANMGKVYAGTSNKEGTYNATSSTSTESSATATSTEASSLSVGPFYAFAQANNGYKFIGWKETNSDVAEIISTANPYSMNITATSTTKNSGTTKTLYAFFQEKKTVNITFIGTNLGSYKYTIDVTTTNVSGSNQTANDVESVTLSTPTPASGYAFAGWYQINTDGSLTDLSGSSSFVVDFSASGSIQIGARFVSTSNPQFIIKETSTTYYGLKAALMAASAGQTVVPTGNHTINGADLISEDNNTYIIPSGITLLVPYSSDNKKAGSSVETVSEKNSTPSLYRTLTFSNEVAIIVNGAIEVGGTQNKDGQIGVSIGGPRKHGKIVLNQGVNMVFNKGASLFCWGFITGQGEVLAKNGAKVYECLQTMDWRGGTCSSGMIDNNYKVFPLCQYYIQNVEAPIVFESGAQDLVSMSIVAGGFTGSAENVSMISTSSSGLFNINSGGNIRRIYDIKTDRQVYEINGDASLDNLNLDVSTALMNITIKSSSYRLPITNNMSIYVKSGTTTLNSSVVLSAGAEIFIEKGATAKIASGKPLVLYDASEWGNYASDAQIRPIIYAPGRTFTSATVSGRSGVKDASIYVKGNLDVSGTLYTTISGANIYSDNTDQGKIIIRTENTSDIKVYQNTNAGPTYDEKTATPAKLHNADGSYTKTSGAPANTTVNYKNGHWGWKVTWKDSDGTTLKTEYCYTTPSDSWLTDNKPTNNLTKDCKTFSSWSKTTDDAAKQERVYTATYSDITYAITYDKGANGTGTIAGGTKTCGTDFTLSNSKFTRTGYTQTGWSTSDGGAKAFALGGKYTTEATQIFYPYWEVNKYTITWIVDGNETKQEKVAYGEKPSYGSTPEKAPDERYTYTFSGWKPNIKLVTGDETYSGSFNAAERYYTIRFLNDDETSVLQTESLQWGADEPTYKETTPTSTKNDGKLRAFRGWAPEIIKVNGDKDYIAQYEVIGILDVPEEQIISIDATVETTTVHVTGQLKVTEGKTLTTDNLILEATPGTSGEITGTVAATKAYFDFSQLGGFRARTWYAVAVPWQVDVPANAEGGVYTTNDGENYTRQELGSTFDLIYYDGALRAQSGHSNACWKYIEDDEASKHIMQPGKAYMIYLAESAKTIRFKRKDGADLLNTALSVTKYESANDRDESWNGIANPATFHAYINPRADKYKDTENAGQVYDGNSRSYTVINLSEKNLVVGQPVFVQATETNSSVTAYSTHDDAYHAAPRRAKAYSDILRLEVNLAANENDKADRIIIRANDEKENDTYIVGQDLVKMGASDIIPQMWVDRYDSRLCINTVAPVNDVATYPLSLFAPKADEYTVSTDATAEDNVTLYLTFDGRPIWNLTYSPYVTSLEKGTNRHYGLMLVRSKAPEVATGMGEVQDGTQPAAQKILLDGQVYILRGGELYSITGQSVK